MVKALSKLIGTSMMTTVEVAETVMRRAVPMYQNATEVVVEMTKAVGEIRKDLTSSFDYNLAMARMENLVKISDPMMVERKKFAQAMRGLVNAINGKEEKEDPAAN